MIPSSVKVELYLLQFPLTSFNASESLLLLNRGTYLHHSVHLTLSVRHGGP